MTFANALADALTAIMTVFLIINSFHAILLMSSVPDLWSHWPSGDEEYFRDLVGSDALPPISVVGEVQRKDADPVSFARMLLALVYPRFEIVLVSDCAADAAFADVVRDLELYEVPPAFTINLRTAPVRAYYRSHAHPRLLYIDKAAASAGEALNAAVNAARYPHTVAAHAAVIFDRDALLRLSRPFLVDRSVACVGAALRPETAERPADDSVRPAPLRGWLLGCQTIEYLRSFVFQRLGWNLLAGNIVFPGNTILFKREHIIGLGGFDVEEEHPGIDLAVRLPRFLTDSGIDATMPVIPDSVARTVLPRDIRTVGSARQSWLRSLRSALVRNSVMFGNPEYGTFGTIAVPYFWIGVILSPAVEIAGYLLLAVALASGVVGASFACVYLAAVVGYGILLSVWTVVFQAISFQRSQSTHHILRLLAYAVVESIGYRQIMALYRTAAFFFDHQPPNHSNGQSSPSGAA
ncbi:MAG: hypothetical protein M3R65_12215 [Gemmatimonadota bacterium]|nr:hypothetical protein [Gemmatimonadota bacterium]